MHHGFTDIHDAKRIRPIFILSLKKVDRPISTKSNSDFKVTDEPLCCACRQPATPISKLYFVSHVTYSNAHGKRLPLEHKWNIIDFENHSVKGSRLFLRKKKIYYLNRIKYKLLSYILNFNI